MIFHWKMIKTETGRESDNIKKIPVYPQESLYNSGCHSKICVYTEQRGEGCVCVCMHVCVLMPCRAFWKVPSTGEWQGWSHMERGGVGKAGG